ncbi:MAG: tetratricopeptide repeat protein [Acidobacteriota bacterium]
MAKKLLLFLLIFLSFCTPRPQVETASSSAEINARLGEADALRRKGCYVSLKRALQIYRDLYGQPKHRKMVAGRLAEALLLLSVREKELGIANKSYLDQALLIIKENPSLGGYSIYAEIARIVALQGKGVMRDIDTRFSWQETAKKVKNADADLTRRAGSDEFSAYMYAVQKCGFDPAYGVSLFEEKGDLGQVLDIFPDSLLLKYKRAICPKENADLLKEILAAEPEFYEANYFLGNDALARGNLLEAEQYFLEALTGIPESPQITISLASVAFAVEEFERSLDFYEKTLALAPEYRDALLGKAICLSYMGRPSEAISVCEKIISLGYWLLGESHYWLAWNQHELKDNVTAAANIEEAKGRLPTSSEVFTLSGTLALEREDLAKAEKDLKEALQYNPANADALMLLGDVYARKKDWPGSAACFEKAGFACEDEAARLEAKIDDLKKSKLQSDRMNALLRRKARQLEKVSLARAAAFYNAGAGYFNCGQRSKVLEMTGKASEHPQFKQKADELASQIK